MGGRTRILVCAFGPFPGVRKNPSEELARRLVRLRRPALRGIELILDILPTRWDALGLLARRLAHERPDGVLLLGVAPRRRALCLETRAFNAAADRPDAARRHPASPRLDPAAPGLLRTTANLAPLLAAARSGRPEARASLDAGRYLCNASYFKTLAWANGRPVLFVHVPGRSPGDASQLKALGAVLLALAAQARSVAREPL